MKRSKGNVFLDIGFDEIEAEELSVKTDFITLIALAIKKRGLSQSEAAKICNADQPTLSKILSGRMDSITIDRLAKWIVALGGDVNISVSPPTKAKVQGRGSLRIGECP